MTEPKKRGRPPKEGGPMSKAEYQQRYRAKKAKEKASAKETYLALSGEALEELSRLAKAFGADSRNQLIESLLLAGIKNARKYEAFMLETFPEFDPENPSDEIIEWQKDTRELLKHSKRFEDYKKEMIEFMNNYKESKR